MEDFGFSIMIPLQLDPLDRRYVEEYAVNARRLNAKRVLVNAPGLRCTSQIRLEDYRRYSDMLKNIIPYFAGHGVETGFWYGPTLGWGVLTADGGQHPYQQLTGHDGREEAGNSCPLDPRFADFFVESMKIIAESGVDLIITEDDYRLHLRTVPFGCFCPLHLATFREETGLDLSRDELARQVLTGGPNEIRNRWMDFLGKGLVELAARVRAAVDQVNPTTRLGITAVMSHFSNEGFDVCSLLKAFAGNNRPFMRSVGAPYWSKNPADIGWIIEYARLQQSYVEETGAELVGEGDTFPHNRYLTPVSFLTAYAQGLAASGFPGLLAYPQSYSSLPSHDDGYVSGLEKQLLNLKKIKEIMPDDYLAVGVMPLEVKSNFKHITLPESIDASLISWPDKPYSLHLLSRLGIPVTFEDETAPVFITGYAAAGLSDESITSLLQRGSVLDGVAAILLFDRGFDIGITQIEPISDVPRFEHFSAADFCGKYTDDYNWLIISANEAFYRCTPKTGVRTVTSFVDPQLVHLFPGVMHYQSPVGYRTAILPISLSVCVPNNYNQAAFSLQRAYQLSRTFAWVGKRQLPVCLPDIPNLHLVARRSRDGQTLAVYVQNLSTDPVDGITLTLPADTGISNIQLLADGQSSLRSITNPVITADGDYTYVALDESIPALGGVVVLVTR